MQKQSPPLSKDDWGYEEQNGPHKWHEHFPVARGKRQSPIDIQTNKAKYNERLVNPKPLTMTYEPESGLELANTGHSIQAAISKHSVLEGGPLTGKYALAQFHMHWGSETGRGSEHTIDGKEYEAELHLVHYNEKYGSFGNAVDRSDGLAVVGIMIQEGKPYKGLSPITDRACKVSKNKDKCRLSNDFNPSSLLPENLTDYWTYLGSLTTPPLFESVTWIVLKDPVEMSKEQLDNLRSMKDCHDLNMQNNYRPPCSLEGRELWKSF